MTHRPSAITHTQEYRVLPGVVQHTFNIFGLFTTPNLCPPDTKSWRRHWSHQLECGVADLETRSSTTYTRYHSEFDGLSQTVWAFPKSWGKLGSAPWDGALLAP